jgi:hypothetical protein
MSVTLQPLVLLISDNQRLGPTLCTWFGASTRKPFGWLAPFR